MLDADALHELEPGDWRPPGVLTPHAGELARLLGEESDWVAAHRLEAARRAAERFGCVCLLKGADTIVAAPDDGTLVCADRRAGARDCRDGRRAHRRPRRVPRQGSRAALAAAAAATAHGLAARSAGRQAGLIASDVVAALPSVLS